MTRRIPKAPKPATIPTMDAQTSRHVDAEIAKLIAESSKLIAETGKLNAEATKFHRERAWYPVVLMTTAVGATAAVVKLFF